MPKGDAVNEGSNERVKLKEGLKEGLEGRKATTQCRECAEEKLAEERRGYV
jgi:hypothetical protein